MHSRIARLPMLISILLSLLVVSANVASGCNTPPASALTTLELPGHPFQVVITADGCWAFASLIGQRRPGMSELAVLRRNRGSFEFARTVPTPSPLFGLALTRDGSRLIAADGTGAVIMDVARLTSGKSPAEIGAIKESSSPATIAVNVTPDGRWLFISDERESSITVADLSRPLPSPPDASAVTGKIPVGIAPIALVFSPDGHWLYTTSQSAQPSWNWPAVCDPENPNAPPSKHPEGAIVVVDVELAKNTPAQCVVSKTTGIRRGSGSGFRPLNVTAPFNWLGLLSAEAAPGQLTPPHFRVCLPQVLRTPLSSAVSKTKS